jgi:hypothetical protein
MLQAPLESCVASKVSLARGLVFSLFLLLGSSEIRGEAQRSPEYPSVQDAVRCFVTSYHFETDIDRQNALAEVKQIDDLRLLASSDRVSFYHFPTAASSLRGYAAIAALISGDVVEVRDERAWNKVVAKINLQIQTPEEAEALVKDFLHLIRITDAVWEGIADGVNFIRGVDDIPFKSDDLEHQVEKLDLTLNSDIRPPSIQPDGVGYVFRGVSWRPYDGAVDEHVLQVEPDGSVTYKHQTLAYPYGDYHAGCVVPLDSGPPMKVLERLGRHGGSEASILVAKYLTMIAQSNFLLYKGFIDRNRDAITCLLGDLQLDTDSRVRLAAIAALDALQGNRPPNEIGPQSTDEGD